MNEASATFTLDKASTTKFYPIRYAAQVNHTDFNPGPSYGLFLTDRSILSAHTLQTVPRGSSSASRDIFIYFSNGKPLLNRECWLTPRDAWTKGYDWRKADFGRKFDNGSVLYASSSVYVLSDVKGVPVREMAVTYLSVPDKAEELLKMRLEVQFEDGTFFRGTFTGPLEEALPRLAKPLKPGFDLYPLPSNRNSSDGSRLPRRSHAKKPVIYLYPPATKKVRVELDYKGNLAATYPKYDPAIKGWSVTARPDGTLVNDADGKEYSYLFWEGKSYDFPIDTSEGFVVKGSDTARFLQTTLKQLGLTPKEYNEFIVYWLPKMQDNPYNFIRFAGREYTDLAPLTITPKPDSMLRVFMTYRPLQEPITVKKQALSSFHRHGFTVIEWGGSEISHSK